MMTPMIDAYRQFFNALASQDLPMPAKIEIDADAGRRLAAEFESLNPRRVGPSSIVKEAHLYGILISWP